jgi:peptidoglycan/LPS O-acetylase OafA/YrhL
VDSKTKVYFPGLNGLRFIAAAAVIISHIELIKSTFGFKDHWSHPLFFTLGSLGVFFFFVLSGFLITYLLLVEKEMMSEIKIKKFYVRRILRIWPLYYLIVIVGFFILPYFPQIHINYLNANFLRNFDINLLLYLFILPNLAFSMYSAVPHIGQTWSIGVEEQFYLFWPWFVKKSDKLMKSTLLFIFFIILLKLSVLFMPASFKSQHFYEPLKRFFAMSKLESMAIGALGADVLFYKKDRWLKIIYNRSVFLLSFLIISILIFYTPNFIQDGIHLLYSICFLIIIMNVASEKKLLINLENKLFRFLGNISYGTYMFHLMIIPIVLYVYKGFNFHFNYLIENCILYSLVFLATIAISTFSYYAFEKKIIRYKSKYTIIDSGSK